MAAVTVVGAGPIGLQTAIGVKQQGFEVEVLEEHREIGKPVACTGLIQKKSCEELGLDVSGCLVNEIRGARIFSPGKHVLEVKRQGTVANMVNRLEFDRMFLKKAEKLGVPVFTDSKVIDVRKNSLFVEADGRGELRKSSIVVGADGPHSVIRNIIQPESNSRNFVHAIQVTAAGSFDKDMVEAHLGSFAPKFFAWVAPESSSMARVGLGAPLGSNLKKLLDEFALERNISLEGCCDKMSGLIPIGPPMKSMTKENMLVIGDAGLVCKSTTGGGLMLGLKAADICSQTIAQHLKNKKPLEDFDKNMSSIKKDLLLHWRIYSFLHSLPVKQVDKYFVQAKKAGIEEFLNRHGDMDHPSRFVGKLLASPSLWGFLPAIAKILF